MEFGEGQRVLVDTGEMDLWKKCLLYFFGIVALLLIIILPLSFVGIEYYEVRVLSHKAHSRFILQNARRRIQIVEYRMMVTLIGTPKPKP